MSDEWGPWIEHDGRGCPCVGAWAQRVISTGGVGKFAESGGQERVIEGIVKDGPLSAWDWSNYLKINARGRLVAKIIRYRIRKPRGLTILESLLENLPDEVPA